MGLAPTQVSPEFKRKIIATLSYDEISKVVDIFQIFFVTKAHSKVPRPFYGAKIQSLY